jgi:phosphohistidine phosphatase
MTLMTDGPPARLVVLVRHARAESGEEGADHDRTLTSRGERDATEAGRWLAGVLPRVSEVWCSSAKRAVQTWSAMEQSLDSPAPLIERDLYLADARLITDRLDGRTSPGPLVVVGHNPTMEHLQAALTGELRGMPAGAVAVVDPERRAVVDSWSPA